MKRTTIFAEEDVLLELKHLAKAQNRTAAEVVRDALQAYIHAHRPKRKRLSFYAMGAFGETDVAERAEEILAREIKRESGWDVDPR